MCRGRASAPRGRPPKRCAPSEGRAEQLVDLTPRPGCRDTVTELDLDKADEERVQRTARGLELLRDLGERTVGGDHRGESRDLAARALAVPDDSTALVGRLKTHGVTKAAPVIPAAA